MGVRIRPARTADAAAIYALGLRCYDVERPPYNYWTEEAVAGALETSPSLCFAAEDAGELVGFLLAHETFERLEDVAYFEWLAVAGDHRGRGVATDLLEAGLAAARRLGKSSAIADIADDNDPSRQLARKHGFADVASVTYVAKDLR